MSAPPAGWRRREVGRSGASAARGSVMVSRPRRLAAGQRPFRRPAHTTPAARRAPTQALPAGAASSRLIPARRPRDRCGLGGVINGHRSLVAPVDDSVHAVSATSDSPGSHRPVPLLRLVALRCEQACGEERDGADHGGVADHGEHRFTRRPVSPINNVYAANEARNTTRARRRSGVGDVDERCQALAALGDRERRGLSAR